MRPFATLLVAFAFASQLRAITVCDLKKNPAAYDHKVVEVSGFVSHGFEDFMLFDPRCTRDEVEIWLEYGGTVGSGTIYCCNEEAARTRDKPLVIDGVTTAIIVDRKLKDFDALIQHGSDSIVHATIRGHFFAGEKTHFPGGTRWAGYGHFGLFSLLTIEQVLAVDPHDLQDVDYRAAPDPPHVNGVGCYSRDLERLTYAEEIAAQQAADLGTRAWAFTDPARVAAESIRANAGHLVPLQIVRRADGRLVFEGEKKYRVVVSRPYWLSFYAADRRRVAWVAIGAYESGCPKSQ